MQSTPASAPPYPPPPQGYVAASPQSYTPPNLLTSTSSPNTASEQQFDYSTAIDPALATSLQSKALPEIYNGLDVKRQQASASPYAPGATGASSPGGRLFFFPPITYPFLAVTASTDPSCLAKRSRIDELIAVEGVPPPFPTVTRPLQSDVYEAVKLAYRQIYGPSIDKFLETQWFAKWGLKYVLEDVHLCERFGSLIQRYTIDEQTPGYQQILAATKSLEASVIWSMMSIAGRVVSSPDASSGHLPLEEVNGGILNAAKRVEILENLLSGQYLDAEATAAAESTRNGTAFELQLNKREREFWQLLHNFLTIHDDEASASQELDAILNTARTLLDERESRDVIYSIAVLRLHGSVSHWRTPAEAPLRIRASL